MRAGVIQHWINLKECGAWRFLTVSPCVLWCASVSFFSSGMTPMSTSHQSHHPADRWYIISEDKPENHINYITIHIPFAVLNNITEVSNFSRIRNWNGKQENKLRNTFVYERILDVEDFAQQLKQIDWFC